MMTPPALPSAGPDLSAPSPSATPDAGLAPVQPPPPQSSFTLSPDAVAASGIQNPQVGQTYSAQVQFTITDGGGAEGGGDGTVTADVGSITEATPIDAANEPGTDTSPEGGDVENSLESDSGGEGDESPASSPSASDDAEEKMLGYKRKKSTKPSFPVKGLTD
jgi:hypothetical protein